MQPTFWAQNFGQYLRLGQTPLKRCFYFLGAALNSQSQSVRMIENIKYGYEFCWEYDKRIICGWVGRAPQYNRSLGRPGRRTQPEKANKILTTRLCERETYIDALLKTCQANLNLGIHLLQQQY